MAGPAVLLARALGRAAGVNDPGVRWRSDAPIFDNQIATLALKGREARLTVERTRGNWRDPSLEPVLERRLS